MDDVATLNDAVTATVIGRRREMAQGEEFLLRAAKGLGVLVLEGERGIGRSTVWREIVARAEQRGFRVLRCQPAETEGRFALSALADLLEGVTAEEMAALSDLQRVALESALTRIEYTAERRDPRTLGNAVRSLLAEIQTSAPLLIAVDDAQWMDRDSAEILEFAMRRMTGTSVGWLFTRRLGDSGHLVPERVVAPEVVRPALIGPVTVAALHHIIKERLGEPLSRSDVVRIHQVSGGNPFYALELARELCRRGRDTAGSLPVPDSIRELLSPRLAHLPEPTREALLAASALSQPTTSLVDESALGEAEEARIVTIDDDGHIAFRHPLYASAVYASASRARRRLVHRRLAERVSDPEERARHLAAAADEPDEAIAAALERGAVVARSRGAWSSAALLLERAARLTPHDHPDRRWRRLIEAAEHHVRAGDRTRARALLEDVAASPVLRRRKAEALRILGDISQHDQRVDESLRLFQQALDFADDPALANIIELGLSSAYSQLFDFDHARLHAYRALERAEAAPGRPLLNEALGYCAMFDYLSGRGVDWAKVDRSTAVDDAGSVLPVWRRPSTMAGLLCAYVGRHAEGRSRLLAVWEAAQEQGEDSDLGFIALWLSWLETRVGDLAAAEAFADASSSFANATGSRSTDAWNLAQRAYISAVRGDADSVRRHCDEAVHALEQYQHVLATIWLAAAGGVLGLSLGDPEAAWRACEPLTCLVEAQGITEPVPLFFLPDAIEALIALGDHGRVEPLIDALERRGRELERGWAIATGARCRALLLAAQGDLAASASAVQRALEAHEHLDLPFELGRTLLVAGVVERRARQRAKARDSFQRAREIFDHVGARLWSERAGDELDRVGLRRGAGEDLTAGERRVADLVAKGLSNREVAAALSVSPKTVEANLGRIYRKLGIASRAELGGWVANSLQT